MKAKELRIGNICREITPQYNKHVIVKQRHFESIENGEIDLFPIPLTEEQLLKLGFIFDKTDSFDNKYYYLDDIGIIQRGGFVYFCKRIDKYDKNMFDYDIIKEVKFVHRLQNLYFEIKDKEL